jgi:hypothetical protein
MPGKTFSFACHVAQGLPIRLFAILAVALLAVLALPPITARSAPLTFTVNQTGDSLDADTGDSKCDVDLVTVSDQCTLRAAIEQANANVSETDTIDFNIPSATDPGCDSGSGVCAIQPTASLPFIADPVVVNGETQPGFAGLPLIDLNGTLTGAGVDGLHITAGGSTVRGLLIRRFTGDGIELAVGGGNTIRGNFIGTDETGTVTDPIPGPTGDEYGNLNSGVFVNGSPDNTVGGTAAGARNVISGNGRTTNSNGDGVEISGAGATGNQVVGNYIGVDVGGTLNRGNRGSGVLISGVANNTIGGTAAGSLNVISGNNGNGVGITGAGATGNVVLGNYIGTDAAGTIGRGNFSPGVVINGAPGNTIGGTTSAARNVISGNNSDGIYITGSGATGNVVQGNFVGTNAAGTTDLGNAFDGVNISGAPGNTIGGTTSAARNVISGNNSDGIYITGSGGTGNLVQGNFIGTDVNGTAAIGNGQGTAGTGVHITNASNNTVGGTAAGARNILSGNRVRGVEISGSSGTGNLVQGNFIGTDVNGTAALGNATAVGGSGVYINGVDNNTIGGTTAAERNVISGNGNPFLSPGVEIVGSGGTGNLVQGNYIGVDVTGGLALGNYGEGVVITSSPGNTIGGTSAGARNVISANGLVGIEISGAAATANLVQGNHIGTDAGGSTDMGNANSGVFIGDAPSNTIGGSVAGARNVISANDAMGVEIVNAGATGNLVQGNYIGTDAGGTLDRGNALYGVYINGAPGNTIGGTTAAERNVISGNNTGVFISAANGNFVRGNFIGTEATGVSALGNTFDGVRIGGQASSSQVGGTASGSGNTIAFNGGDGVRVDTGTGNVILGNSVHSNTELGTDLANDGADTNDVGDADTGANNKQNYPVLTSALSGSIRVQGTLNSTAGTTFRLEFFSNPACDTTGRGEGKTFLGNTSVTTDGSGNASFDAVFYVTVAVGDWVTGTATDPANNTSEFSACQQIVAGPPIPTPTPGPTPTPTPPPSPDPSYFHPLAPVRLLDTRNGTGTGGSTAKLGAGQELALQVTGTGVVPAGATAVVLNVTVTEPTASSFLTVYPFEVSRPVASNLNFVANDTRPNAVTARLGPSGTLKIYNLAGATHVIADVAGWYDTVPAGGSLYNALAPTRILDTRNGTGGVSGPLAGGEANTLTFKVSGRGGVPSTGATAVVLNTTVTQPTASSFLTLYPADAPARPTASNLNFVAGQTVPNLVTVKLSATGYIKIYNHLGSTHVILDVAGWYGATGQFFRAVTPARALDTRNGTGGTFGKLGAMSTLSLSVLTVGGLPGSPSSISAVVVNATVTEPSASSFLTLFPSNTSRPNASNLNFVAGQTVPNMAITKVGLDGQIKIYNHQGSTHVIVDVAGWFGP